MIAAACAGGVPLIGAVVHASWSSIAAALYLGLIAGRRLFDLGRSTPAVSARRSDPFALLAPCTGVVASADMLGEVFGPARYAGMALILVGLAVVIGAPAGTSAAPIEQRSDPVV